MAERQQRLVFGEDAELYDRARPSYPDALLDEVVRLAGSSALVLEVGCGTGKATVQLAARGLVGTAVEADPKMAAVARRNLAGATGWTVDVSDFETWERSGGPRAFDLVCSAQAWHWIDPEVRFHKAHGLLRTGGWLALWWNRPAEVSSPVVDAVSRTYDAIAPDLRAGVRGIGSKERPAPDVPPGLSFGEPVQHEFAWAREYSAEEWVQLLRTQSDHRMLPPRQLDELTAAISQVVREHGGRYRHPYLCYLWAAQKY